MDDITLKDVIEQLDSIFSSLNNQFYNNQLEKPVITVSPDTTKGAYGWCTSKRIWQVADKNQSFYEINICAEYLGRKFEDICETILHEMVHLYNLMNGVSDTSNNGNYHNKKFMLTAQEHGLVVSKSAKYGYSQTELTSSALEYIQSLDGQQFNLYRSKFAKTKKSASRRKQYYCPDCEMKIAINKEANLICGECMCGLELVDED